jgi:hypothetical protein
MKREKWMADNPRKVLLNSELAQLYSWFRRQEHILPKRTNEA